MTSWRRAPTADGCPTLLHPVHGEPCHDTRGAWAEALQLHVAGCDLPRRLLLGERVRLLELGTAPGWNLAAASHLASGLPGRLDITAIERSVDALLAGADLAADEAWKAQAPVGAAQAFDRTHRALARALAQGAGGEWVELSSKVRLRLFLEEADAALQRLDAHERFDAVFLDAFSPQVEPKSWAPEALRALADRVADGGRLTTYTLSQAVRAALMARGLNIGWAGARSGRRGGTWASRGGWVPPLERRLTARLLRRSERLRASQGWEMALSDLD